MSLSLVTGGAGFVGRHLVDRLRAKGEVVRVLDLKATGADDVAGSVTDAEVVGRAVAGVQRVYHLAGIADLWLPDPARFDRVNAEGTEVLLAAAMREGVGRFILCSSATTLVGVKAPIGPSTVDERTRLPLGEMLGAYPRSKRRAELAVEAAAARGFDALIVNPTEPVGAGDEALTPPTRMMLDFVAGRTPAYIDCILNFAPAASLADAMIAAAEHGKRGERYLLGGENTRLADLLDLLGKLSGRPMPRTRLPYTVALVAGAIDTHIVARLTGKSPKAPLTGVRLAGRQVAFDSGKAARDLGWRAAPYEPALAEMLTWATARGLIG